MKVGDQRKGDMTVVLVHVLGDGVMDYRKVIGVLGEKSPAVVGDFAFSSASC